MGPVTYFSLLSPTPLSLTARAAAPAHGFTHADSVSTGRRWKYRLTGYGGLHTVPRCRPFHGKILLYVEIVVTEPTNYMRLSKKIIHRADDLANLSPYNPVVRENTIDFKPTYIPAKIVISSAVTITSYIKVYVTNTSEFKRSYYKPVSKKVAEAFSSNHTLIQSSKYSASSGSSSNKSIRRDVVNDHCLWS
jgi:hypothetical protein